MPTRRAFLATAAAAAATPAAPIDYCIFSKHLHFLDWAEMAAAAKEIGFTGVDLTVRPGGHVLPERVTEDLPRAADAIHKAGLKLSMITSGIADLSTPHTETILKTAAKLGVRHYRWDGFRYKEGHSLPAQIEGLQPKVAALAAFNKSIGMKAIYHTHSGLNRVGASQWDLWLLLKDHDPRYVAFNLDAAHATIEGGLGGWVHSTRLALPYLGGIAVKDFRWEKGPNGKYRVAWCPIGEGMVQIQEFLKIVQSANFQGPAQVHYEYDLGGADKGLAKITWPKEKVLAAMRRDLVALKAGQ